MTEQRTLAELKAAMEERRIAASEAEHSYLVALDAYHAELVKTATYKVGDRVSERGFDYEISDVRPSGYTTRPFYYFGRKVLKGGALHKNSTRLWELKEAQQ
jgi:hypothetical protein